MLAHPATRLRFWRQSLRSLYFPCKRSLFRLRDQTFVQSCQNPRLPCRKTNLSQNRRICRSRPSSAESNRSMSLGMFRRFRCGCRTIRPNQSSFSGALTGRVRAGVTRTAISKLKVRRSSKGNGGALAAGTSTRYAVEVSSLSNHASSSIPTHGTMASTS